MIRLEQAAGALSGTYYYLPPLYGFPTVQGQIVGGLIQLRFSDTYDTEFLLANPNLLRAVDGTAQVGLGVVAELERLSPPGAETAGRWVMTILRLNNVTQVLDMADTLYLEADGRASHGSERFGCGFHVDGTYRKATTYVELQWPRPVPPLTSCPHYLPGRDVLQREGGLLVRRQAFETVIREQVYQRR